jgi:hypothetical protein
MPLKRGAIASIGLTQKPGFFKGIDCLSLQVAAGNSVSLNFALTLFKYPENI